jgi:hypothetical protein
MTETKPTDSGETLNRALGEHYFIGRKRESRR